MSGFDQRPFRVGFVVERAVRSLQTVQSVSLHYHCTDASYTLAFPFSATDAIHLTQPVSTALLSALRIESRDLTLFEDTSAILWQIYERLLKFESERRNSSYTAHDQNLRLTFSNLASYVQDGRKITL
jgi:hypothetical protein